MPSFTIALRYLRGKRGVNAAPLLSRISMLALAVGAASLLILFSVFNGFEQVVSKLYTAFYSDMRISPAQGKFFVPDSTKLLRIRQLNGIAALAPVIEDNVFVHSEDEQMVVTLKGVTGAYFKVNKLTPYIISGRDTVRNEALPTAIVGVHIAARLGLSVDNDFSRIDLYYPNPELRHPVLNPADAYGTLELRPDGIFKVQEEFDARYVLAPLPLVQQLFHRPGAVSSLELKLAPGANQEALRRQVQQILGPGFTVATRFEQNHTINSVMRTEKWATYVILLFILLIASVNMVGAMSLLVLEKRRDMAILTAMGAGRSLIRKIFLYEGLLWAAVGGGVGIGAGALLCLGQQRWGWVKLNGVFIIDAYPVAMQASDFVVIALTVLGVGVLAALYPALRSGRGLALE
ncbi:MAG: ABC transporter permease [Bacteroidetes bacterium]|nr:ABC transporter permease [Bacteroidota bacterium]